MSKYAPHRSSSNNPRSSATTVCQKCLKTGAWTRSPCHSTPRGEENSHLRYAYQDTSSTNARARVHTCPALPARSSSRTPRSSRSSRQTESHRSRSLKSSSPSAYSCEDICCVCVLTLGPGAAPRTGSLKRRRRNASRTRTRAKGLRANGDGTFLHGYYYAYMDSDMSLVARDPLHLRQAPVRTRIATVIPTLTLEAPPILSPDLSPTTRAALAARAPEGNGTVVRAVVVAPGPGGDRQNSGLPHSASRLYRFAPHGSLYVT